MNTLLGNGGHVAKKYKLLYPPTRYAFLIYFFNSFIYNYKFVHFCNFVPFKVLLLNQSKARTFL